MVDSERGLGKGPKLPTRRKFLQLAGAAVAALALGGESGCGAPLSSGELNEKYTKVGRKIDILKGQATLKPGINLRNYPGGVGDTSDYGNTLIKNLQGGNIIIKDPIIIQGGITSSGKSEAGNWLMFYLPQYGNDPVFVAYTPETFGVVVFDPEKGYNNSRIPCTVSARLDPSKDVKIPAITCKTTNGVLINNIATAVFQPIKK